MLVLMVLLGALALVGLYATFTGIPRTLKGVPRMHIYAPPTTVFIVVASLIAMLAPHTGLAPATAVNLNMSLVLSLLFASIGLTTIGRRLLPTTR